MQWKLSIILPPRAQEKEVEENKAAIFLLSQGGKFANEGESLQVWTLKILLLMESTFNLNLLLI